MTEQVSTDEVQNGATLNDISVGRRTLIDSDPVIGEQAGAGLAQQNAAAESDVNDDADDNEELEEEDSEEEDSEDEDSEDEDSEDEDSDDDDSTDEDSEDEDLDDEDSAIEGTDENSAVNSQPSRQ